MALKVSHKKKTTKEERMSDDKLLDILIKATSESEMDAIQEIKRRLEYRTKLRKLITALVGPQKTKRQMQKKIAAFAEARQLVNMTSIRKKT